MTRMSIKELAEQIIQEAKAAQQGPIGSPNRPKGMGGNIYIEGILTQIAREHETQRQQYTNPTGKQRATQQKRRRIRQGRGREPKYWVTINEENQNSQKNNKTFPDMAQQIKLNMLLEELEKRSKQEGRQGKNLRRIGITSGIISEVRRKLTETTQKNK